MGDLEFIQIIDRTYPWFPPAFDRDSIGIDLSNANYDSDLGQQVLEDVGHQAQLAENLGYDGVLLFEQHGHPLALFGNTVTGAAWLAGITNNIKIGAIGPIMNNYQSPVRLAEEIALVDTVSRGRLIVGLPMGIGAQYHAVGTMNPAHARDRYLEGLALLDKIWKEDGPFAWEGEYFHIPYVNVWPRPIQRPRPRVFIPAAGSRESLEVAAKYRFTYQAVAVPGPKLKANIKLFRDLCNEEGYEPDPSQLVAVTGFYLADSENEAKRELERHAHWTAQNIMRYAQHESFPPGHVTIDSLRSMLDGGYRSKGNDPGKVSGSAPPLGMTPEQVREIIQESVEDLGFGGFIVGGAFSLPPWLAHKQMQIFAEEVMPYFRTDGKPSWAREPTPGWTSASERVARKPHYGGQPLVEMPGRGRLPLFEMDEIKELDSE
jgi:alkanesulfonate monooxygenase SsuD/methylene tetrahydromethanopterin reductase-like flavin-dependent oxidoreductase (luciferase family)